MSYVNQEPIYETVCIATEQKIVGYKEVPVDNEYPDLVEGIEVPLDVREVEVIADVPPGTLSSFPDAPTPGAIVVPPYVPPVDTPEVPIPGAAFLFAGGLALYITVRKWIRA